MEKNNITELRIEIETKLEYESRKLKYLKEHAQQNRNITKIVNASVMEKCFENLEKKFLPIYTGLVNLQRVHHNLECTLAVFDHYSVAQEVQDIVHAGPQVEGLDKFLMVAKRLQKAFNHFEKYNPQSVGFANVSSLCITSGDALNKYFKLLLLQNSRPVLPDKLLSDMAYIGALGGESALLNPFPVCLTAIAECLATQNRLEFISLYEKTRAAILMISYDKLKKYQQSLKIEGSVQSVELSNGIFEQVDLQLDKAVYRQEIVNYLIQVRAVQMLMQKERSIMVGIIPVQRLNQVFQSIISEPLNSIVKDGLNIATQTDKYIKCYSCSVLSTILPALRELLSLRSEFDQIVEGCEDNVRFQFAKVFNNIRKTVAKWLCCNLTEHFRSDPSPGLPKDVVVHETTISVLKFLGHLLEYTDIIAEVLRESLPYDSFFLQKSNIKKDKKNEALLGIYATKVLSKLNLLLIHISDDYKDTGVRTLFRLVNCQHILKVLSQSPLLKLIIMSQPEYLQTYVNMLLTHKKSYKQCWNKALSYIVGNDDVVNTAGKLQDKDRYVIKGKFVGFNKELEDVLYIQLECSVTDVDLKEGLKHDNKEYVLPIYSTFYSKFSALNFTKNPDKYMKYTPKKLAAVLDQLFDIAETTV